MVFSCRQQVFYLRFYRQSTLLTSRGIARPPYINSRFILVGIWWGESSKGIKTPRGLEMRSEWWRQSVSRIAYQMNRGRGLVLRLRANFNFSRHQSPYEPGRRLEGCPGTGEKGLEWNTKRIWSLTTSVLCFEWAGRWRVVKKKERAVIVWALKGML